MRSRRRRKRVPSTLLLAELATTSLETIARRSLLMLSGTCSAREYRRMLREKQAAYLASSKAMVLDRSGDPTGAIIEPWLKRARANAKRLRRR